MKIAVCLYGLFNNRHSKISGFEGFLEIKKLIESHPEDTFSFWIYSTDLGEEAAIRHLYKTLDAKILIVEQQNFSQIMKGQGIDAKQFDIPSGFRSFENLLSFYYSRGKAIEMMLSDSSEGEFDWVIVSRFDSGQLDRYNGRQRAQVAAIGYNNFLERGSFYSAAWDQHNIGYADQWFVGSREDMKTLMGMYGHSLSYLKTGSDYLTHLKGGIFDSNSENEFSNERNLPEEKRSRSLLKLPGSKALNGHLMHKFFFWETELYSKSKFSLNHEGVALVVYSHSDYFDSMKLMHDTLGLYYNAFRKRHLIANNEGEWGELGYSVALYSEESSYVDRLIQGLVQIEDEVIFFNHEDFLLIAEPDYRHFLDALELVKLGKLDYFTFARGGIQVGLPILGRRSCSRFVNSISPWIFSIQPSLWNRRALLRLLEKHRGQNIWEFESGAQKSFRKMGLRGGFTTKRGKKRGQLHWDNPMYPYIATAIVKGRWNTLEYLEELQTVMRDTKNGFGSRGTNS
jgi:hypothetical protein